MHDVEHKGLRYTLASAGLAASLIFLMASGVANYRYGYNLARTPTDGVMYGIAAAAGDVFMAATPFFLFAAIRNRAYLQAFAAFIVWVATTLFAAQAAVSHASVNRMDAVSARTVAATTYADAREELLQARRERGFIPQHRPSDTLKAEMERHKTNRHWTNTNECTEPAGKAQRDFCAQYHVLNGEMGYALQASKLDARIEALTNKSDNVAANNTSVQSEADPGARTISVMSGIDIRTVQGMSIFMVAFLILIGAGLGPYISTSVIEIHQSRRRPVTIEGEIIHADLKADAQRALPAPGKSAGAQPTPDKPLPAPQLARPEPAPEARKILDAIAFPRSRLTGERRPKEDAHRTALRYLGWLYAYDLTGKHSVDAFDDFYKQFVLFDHRDECGLRVVKPELRNFARFIATGGNPVVWEIKPQPLAKVIALLEKEKIASSAPKPAEGDSKVIRPFGADAGAAPDAPSAAVETPVAPIAKGPVKGLAQLSRYMPDMDSLRAMARTQKREWQQRFMTADRKQQNRHRRSRAA